MVAAHLNRGVMMMAALADGDRDTIVDAVSSFERALAIAPDIAACHTNRGLALERLRADAAEVLATHDLAVALDPADVKALASRADYVMRTSRRMRAAGRLPAMDRRETLAAYDHVLALSPANVETLHNRALVLHEIAGATPAVARRRGAYREALASVDLGLRIEQSWPDLHFVRANSLDRMGADAVQVLAAFDACLALAPAHTRAHTNRGLALATVDRPWESLAAHERAFATDPAVAGLYVNRANMLETLGADENEILALLDRAIALEPTLSTPTSTASGSFWSWAQTGGRSLPRPSSRLR